MGIRAVADSESSRWGSLHLHPQDTGTLMSVDHDKEAAWSAAGPIWRERSGVSSLAGMAGLEIAASDPAGMEEPWAELLGLPRVSMVSIALGEGTVTFTASPSGAEGLVAVECSMADDGRVGECHSLGGTTFRVVAKPS